MKKILFLLILLLSLGVVTASNPNYIVTNLLENDIINGVNDGGDILFVAEPYTPDIYNMSIIETKFMQQYDRIQWKGLNSVKLIPPPGLNEVILVTNSIYDFSTIGVYTLQSNLNISNSSILNIIQADINQVNLKILEQPSGFEIAFSQSSFILDTEKAISLEIEIDDDVEPGNYNIDYQIEGKGTKTNFSNTFEVGINNNWTVYKNTLEENKSVKNGVSDFYGYLELLNKGNVDIDISVIKSGNSTFMLSTPAQQTLFKKSNLILNFQIQVPSIQTPGIYEMEIEILGGGLNETFPINITVQDSINPIIESINFSTDKVFKENKITVISTDNNDVKNVTMNYGGKLIYLNKDQNLFTCETNFTKLSNYIFEFCAIDTTGNKACVITNKTFIKISVINNFTKILNMPSMKVGKYSRIELFNITKEVPEGVIFELVDFTGEGIQNYTGIVRIVDEDGSIKQFGDLVNEVTVTDVGQVFLEVRSDIVADYNGVLRVYLPEYIEGVEDITFKTSFKEYDVPEDFTLEWFDDSKINCDIIDSGDLDSSYYYCTMKFPIDVKKEDIAFPTTAREKERLDSDVFDVQEDWSKSKKRSALVITFLIVVLIMTGGWSYYMTEIYPNVRFYNGKTK